MRLSDERLTIDEARARVTRGAAVLDRWNPAWPSLIDVGVLSIESGDRCICAQLGWSSDGALALHRGGDPIGVGVLVKHGDHETRAHAYGLLQDAWIAAIADRLHPVPESAADALARAPERETQSV